MKRIVGGQGRQSKMEHGNRMKGLPWRQLNVVCKSLVRFWEAQKWVAVVFNGIKRGGESAIS